jgi:hypothetical protein
LQYQVRQDLLQEAHFWLWIDLMTLSNCYKYLEVGFYFGYFQYQCQDLP